MAKPAVTQREPEHLPAAVVEYYPDTQTLIVDNGQRRWEGEDMAHGLTVFYDEQDNVQGFTMEAAEFLLESFVAAIRAQSEQ